MLGKPLFLGLAELYITIIIGSYQGTGGIENPAQCGLEVPGRRVSLRVQVAFNVINGAFQNKDLIPESIEFCSLDDEFILAEFEFFGALTSHPVPLTTGLTAELAWTATCGPWWHRLAAPDALACP
jgi:hypothetical protein